MLKKFLAYKAGPCDDALTNEWFYHSRRMAIPCITIRAYRKFATVDFVSDTLPDNLYDLLHSKEAELVAMFRVLSDRYGSKKMNRWVGAGSSRFTNIPIEQAKEFAEAMFDFVYEALGLNAMNLEPVVLA